MNKNCCSLTDKENGFNFTKLKKCFCILFYFILFVSLFISFFRSIVEKTKLTSLSMNQSSFQSFESPLFALAILSSISIPTSGFDVAKTISLLDISNCFSVKNNQNLSNSSSLPIENNQESFPQSLLPGVEFGSDSARFLRSTILGWFLLLLIVTTVVGIIFLHLWKAATCSKKDADVGKNSIARTKSFQEKNNFSFLFFKSPAAFYHVACFVFSFSVSFWARSAGTLIVLDSSSSPIIDIIFVSILPLLLFFIFEFYFTIRLAKQFLEVSSSSNRLALTLTRVGFESKEKEVENESSQLSRFLYENFLSPTRWFGRFFFLGDFSWIWNNRDDVLFLVKNGSELTTSSTSNLQSTTTTTVKKNNNKRSRSKTVSDAKRQQERESFFLFSVMNGVIKNFYGVVDQYSTVEEQLARMNASLATNTHLQHLLDFLPSSPINNIPAANRGANFTTPLTSSNDYSATSLLRTLPRKGIFAKIAPHFYVISSITATISCVMGGVARITTTTTTTCNASVFVAFGMAMFDLSFLLLVWPFVVPVQNYLTLISNLSFVISLILLMSLIPKSEIEHENNNNSEEESIKFVAQMLSVVSVLCSCSFRLLISLFRLICLKCSGTKILSEKFIFEAAMNRVEDDDDNYEEFELIQNNNNNQGENEQQNDEEGENGNAKRKNRGVTIARVQNVTEIMNRDDDDDQEDEDGEFVLAKESKYVPVVIRPLNSENRNNNSNGQSTNGGAAVASASSSGTEPSSSMSRRKFSMLGVIKTTNVEDI